MTTFPTTVRTSMASVTPLVEVLLIAALTIVAAASVGTIVLV